MQCISKQNKTKQNTTHQRKDQSPDCKLENVTCTQCGRQHTKSRDQHKNISDTKLGKNSKKKAKKATKQNSKTTKCDQ